MKAGGLWVYKTEDKSVKVEVKDMKFTMPAYPVTIAVEFEKDNTGSAAVENALYASIAIGPNPFVEELRIFVGLYNKATIEYRLYSAQGIVVRSGKLEGEDASIETRSLPAGIYLLELSTQGGYTRAWKLIK